MAPGNSIIAVLLNIGHKAVHRTTPHPSGYTHDWSAYVTGADDIDIHHFVEKVIFTLHETFDEPTQVVSSAPYMISEAGYASFGLKLDIHFNNTACRNGENIIHYEYDLYLPGEGQPSVKHFRQERLLFKNTPVDFRAKLIAGGAKETDPDALEEMAKERKAEERAAAAASSANMADKPNLSDDEKKGKKKKHKDKSDKHKKSKEKEKSSKSSLGDVSSGLFNHPKFHEEKSIAPAQMDMSNSESSSSSSSSSPSFSPGQSPLLAARSSSQNSKNKIPALSASESSDSDEDDNFNNNSSIGIKRNTPPPNHVNSNIHTSKKPKAADKPTKKSERNLGMVAKGPNGVPLDVLLDLHEKIKGTEDPQLLQRFVDVIEETSHYKLTESSFDFDLCILEAPVIHKLENIFK